MFTIEKDLSGIFWHIYNNSRTRVNVSDFDVVIDSISQTFIIQCKNGSNIPSQAIAISLMQVIDLSVGTSPIAFSGAEGLIQLLMAKNYTPYLQDAPSESVYVYRVGQVGVFTMTPTQFTDNFDGTGLGRNTMLGWALRNGSNGTKNQQGKFSLNKGASPYDVIGAIGGSPNAVLIGHKHKIAKLSGNFSSLGGTAPVSFRDAPFTVDSDATGLSENGVSVPDQSGVGKNMPPYLIDVWVERVTDLVITTGSGGGGGGGVQTVTGVNVTGTPTDRVVGVPTLQQVTGEDNETTSDITVKDSESKISLRPRSINFQDIDEGGDTSLRFINTVATDQEIEIRGLGGTMALTSDIPTLVAGTNITIDDADPLNPIISASGGGGSQTLGQTLLIGQRTDGSDIIIDYGDAILLNNTSSLREGSYNFGGNGGISRICSNQYEDNWQNGFRHVFDQSGFIRNSSNCFDIVPDSSFDVTLRFAVGSFWTLDNDTTYVCTDNTEGAAVWEIYSVGGIPTLQEVTDEGNTITTDFSVITLGNDSVSVSDVFDSTLISAISAGGFLSNGVTSQTQYQYNKIYNADETTNKFLEINYPTSIVGTNKTQTFQDASGTIALTSDIPAAQVNSDWNAVSGVAEILNKPTIPTTTSQLTNNGANGVNPFITALDIPTTGEASTLVREVKNMTGATLTKGTVVYISGANGNKALVSKAIATTDALSARTFGLLQSDILNNGLGNCVIIGDLTGINTSSFAEGAQLYLSGTVAGAFTDVRALAPTHLVYVGKVTRVHPTQGQIEVQIQNGYELEEIHDVQIVTPLNNQLLAYTSATSLWQNKNLIDILEDFNKTKGIYFFEEFMGNQAGGITTNFAGLITTQTGASANCITTGTITNRTNQQGVVRTQTGTTATGQAGFLYGGVNLFRGTGTVSIETYATIETLSTSTERFFTIFGHIGVANYNNPANGIFFAYDEGGVIASGANAGSPNFKCVSINTLTRTFFTSSVPVVAGQWYKLRIDLNAAGTQASYFIDGNLITTISTNIPATSTAMGVHSVIVKTVGTTTRAMQTDYFNYEEIFTNPR